MLMQLTGPMDKLSPWVLFRLDESEVDKMFLQNGPSNASSVLYSTTPTVLMTTKYNTVPDSLTIRVSEFDCSITATYNLSNNTVFIVVDGNHERLISSDISFYFEKIIELENLFEMKLYQAKDFEYGQPWNKPLVKYDLKKWLTIQDDAFKRMDTINKIMVASIKGKDRYSGRYYESMPSTLNARTDLASLDILSLWCPYRDVTLNGTIVSWWYRNLKPAHRAALGTSSLVRYREHRFNMTLAHVQKVLGLNPHNGIFSIVEHTYGESDKKFFIDNWDIEKPEVLAKYRERYPFAFMTYDTQEELKRVTGHQAMNKHLSKQDGFKRGEMLVVASINSFKSRFNNPD